MYLRLKGSKIQRRCRVSQCEIALCYFVHTDHPAYSVRAPDVSNRGPHYSCDRQSRWKFYISLRSSLTLSDLPIPTIGQDKGTYKIALHPYLLRLYIVYRLHVENVIGRLLCNFFTFATPDQPCR